MSCVEGLEEHKAELSRSSSRRQGYADQGR
jgi:hypothetical protein